jgi:bacillithiol biosynthesis cysteine-adding enzyme BshC
MKSGCVRQTSLPGTSRLFADLLYHFDRVERFYGRQHTELASYQAAAQELDYPRERRQQMAGALEAINGRSAELELFARPETAVVVTGQQVGLFGGPCYTIYKALTAAKLAQRLNEAGTPAVAVFWLATEDHDFAEVNHAWGFDTAHRPRKFSVQQAGAGKGPVGVVRPESYPVGELRESLNGFAHAQQVVSLVEQAYAPGRSLGEAFQHLVKALLPGVPLLFIDPLHPAVRPVAAGLLADAAKAAPEITADVMRRNTELESAGYHAQVHVEAKTSLFFLLENGVRKALRVDGDRYVLGGAKLTADDLAARAADLSPNALLRPVMQDYLLPTVAYVGGPAELAYLAQAEVAYRRLLGRFPVVVPRNGFTLVDDASATAMGKFGLDLTSLFTREGIRGPLSRRLIPEGIGTRIEAARSSLEKNLDGLSASLHEFDPTLAAALKKSRAKMLYQLSKIEGKAAREALRRDTDAQQAASAIESLLYPGKHLQERYYSILPFVARHGTDLIASIGENVRLDCPDHVVLTI